MAGQTLQKHLVHGHRLLEGGQILTAGRKGGEEADDSPDSENAGEE